MSDDEPGLGTAVDDARGRVVPSWLRLVTAARVLRDERVSHLLVVDHGHVLTVAERDVLRRLLEDPRYALETVDGLARPAREVAPGTSTTTAACLLGVVGGPELLVVRDAGGGVVGVVTPRSLLRAVAADRAASALGGPG